jgi:hypothetical protein
MFRDERARTAASLALLLISGVLLVVGAVALYARNELVDEDEFADRAVDALRDDDVREVVADEIVTEIIDQGAAELLTVRPLLTTGVTALLDTPQFRRLFRAAVRDAHELFLERGDADLVIDLANAGTLVAEALASVSPEVAEDLPDDLRPQVAELRESDFAARAVRGGNSLRTLGIVLPLLALLGFAGAAAIAPSRRAALTGAGMALATGGAAVAAALLAWRALAVDSVEESGLLESDDVRAAAGAVWDAYLGDLRVWALVAVGAGLVLTAVGGAGLRPAGAAGDVGRLARALVVRPQARSARIARALGALALGGLLLLKPTLALQLGGLVAGAVLVLVGTDELVAAIERARREPARVAARRRVVAGLAGSVGAVVLALAAVGVAAALRGEADEDPAPVPPEAEERGCNGSPALCPRLLNQVTFPATHNSFSAAAEPGWLFANQRFGIARQLDDGIRGLLLDVHYGVRDPDGAVRTDLRAEGESRNRAARRLSPRALEIADRLVGRVGLGELGGERELFLCHTLCELGAEPLGEELETIRRFLERNPAEVLIVMIEPYVSAGAVEQAFDDAGLLPHVAALRRDEPLPTLGELVDDERRLVVLTEDEGGTPAWHHPAFSFVQDTPIGDTPSGGCRPNRGDGNSPLLMLNNWIDGFPPSPSSNRSVGERSFILERVRRCRELRGLTPNLIAVDFYERSDVLALARDLNAARP